MSTGPVEVCSRRLSSPTFHSVVKKFAGLLPYPLLHFSAMHCVDDGDGSWAAIVSGGERCVSELLPTKCDAKSSICKSARVRPCHRTTSTSSSTFPHSSSSHKEERAARKTFHPPHLTYLAGNEIPSTSSHVACAPQVHVVNRINLATTPTATRARAPSPPTARPIAASPQLQWRSRSPSWNLLLVEESRPEATAQKRLALP